MVASAAAARLARSSRAPVSSARRRVISAARAGTSAKAVARYRQISAGNETENPSVRWRAIRFLVVTSGRSSGGVLRGDSVTGITPSGRRSGLGTGEPSHDAGHQVGYLGCGGGRGEEEPEQQAQEDLPDLQAHVAPGHEHHRAQERNQRNRDGHGLSRLLAGAVPAGRRAFSGLLRRALWRYQRERARHLRHRFFPFSRSAPHGQRRPGKSIWIVRKGYLL